MTGEAERKSTLILRIFQVAMIVLLVAGYLLIRFAGVPNNLVMIVFFSIFAAGYVTVTVVRMRIRRKDDETVSNETPTDENGGDV